MVVSTAKDNPSDSATKTGADVATKYIFLANGEKGGVGKSQVAKLCSYMLGQLGIDYYPIECDRSNTDLYHAYPKTCKLTYFTEREQEQNKATDLVKYALEKSVVVSLPAQVHRPLVAWFERNKIMQIAQLKNIKVVNLFVTNGSKLSLGLFRESMRGLPKGVDHVLVKNLRKRENWSKVDAKLAESFKEFKFHIIECPIIDYDDQDCLEGDNPEGRMVSIEDAIAKNYLDMFGIIRVQDACDRFIADFKSLGYVV